MHNEDTLPLKGRNRGGPCSPIGFYKLACVPGSEVKGIPCLISYSAAIGNYSG